MDKELLGSKEINLKIEDLTKDIIENNSVKNLCIIGIKTRGEFLGRRIADNIYKTSKNKIPFGTLDITLYRDDFREKTNWPELKQTDISFNVEGLNVIIVDDVLYTGRTIRAAINAIMDYGRPAKVKLAVLVDRGNRELPIQPDYTGVSIKTNKSDKIQVLLKESDGEDSVVLIDKA